MLTDYKKNGYHWQVIVCDEVKAISTNGSHYEVFYWQHNPERVISGVTIAASITPPSNEQWGSEGWTYMSFDAAMYKFKSLKRKEVKHGD